MSTRIMSSGSTVTVEIVPDTRRHEAALTRLRDRTRRWSAKREAAYRAAKAARSARWSEYHRRQKRRNR